MAALCLSWNVGHDKLRWALIATLVFAVSGNLAASEDGPFWHAACMLLSCHSWKKWCHNAIAGVVLIHLVPQRFEEMPAKLRYLKAIKNCSIHFSPYFRPTFISISSTSLLCKASCECYCSIGSLGPQIKEIVVANVRSRFLWIKPRAPTMTKATAKHAAIPFPATQQERGVVTMWEAVFFLHICRPYILQLRTLAELLPSAVLLPGSQTAQTTNLTCPHSAQAWSRLQVCDQIHGLLPCNTWSQVSLILFHSYWEWLKLSSWHADAALA